MRLELSLLDRSKTADAQALANKLDRLADQISSSGKEIETTGLISSRK